MNCTILSSFRCYLKTCKHEVHRPVPVPVQYRLRCTGMYINSRPLSGPHEDILRTALLCKGEQLCDMYNLN